jgi:hypothetical protein
VSREVPIRDILTSRKKDLDCRIVGGLGPLIFGKEVTSSYFGKGRIFASQIWELRNPDALKGKDPGFGWRSYG